MFDLKELGKVLVKWFEGLDFSEVCEVDISDNGNSSIGKFIFDFDRSFITIYEILA
jgi:hypothetical protein